MNQKTLLTLAVIGGLGAVAYMVYKNQQAKNNPPVPQVVTPGNAAPTNGSNTAAIINAGSDALSKVADIFGA